MSRRPQRRHRWSSESKSWRCRTSNDTVTIRQPAAAPKLSGCAHSPPCEGGVALPLRKCREASEAAETGWSLTHHVSKRISKRFGVSDPPGALRHPPLQGGECRTQKLRQKNKNVQALLH